MVVQSSTIIGHEATVFQHPSFRNAEGALEFDATGKPELFANTFQSKYKLIPSEENENTNLQDVDLRQLHQNLPPEKEAAAILKTLKADSATGPDLLPARILKECCLQLAGPLRMLAQSILHFGAWPRSWMVHWIVPLFKKGTVFTPGNYRGIHLTPQISKAMERFLGLMIAPYMSAPVCIGHNQFAYQKARGARDALAFMVITWIQGFNDKRKFSVYCSDVSGAFDRVSRKRLMDKLRAKGVLEVLVQVFAAWLGEREALVVVGGKHSAVLRLENMILPRDGVGAVVVECLLRGCQVSIVQAR